MPYVRRAVSTVLAVLASRVWEGVRHPVGGEAWVGRRAACPVEQELRRSSSLGAPCPNKVRKLNTCY